MDAVIRPFEPAGLPALQRVDAAAFAPILASFRAIVGPAIAPVAFARAEEEQAALLDAQCRERSDHRCWSGCRTLGPRPKSSAS